MKPFHALSVLLASLFFSVGSAFAAGGDLSVSDADIKFSTSTFLEGNNTRLWVSVHNNSGSDLLGSVRFSDQFGAIGSDQPISALAGSTDAVFVDWTPRSFGEYTLTIRVVPWEASGDNPGNNTVVKTVFVAQDSDHDGITNSADPDDDNDGVVDEEDAFPLNSKETVDTDGDGMGNTADLDDDNDGVLDTEDDLPLDPLHSKDMDKDGIADEEDEDIDGDGLNNEDEPGIGTDPRNPDTDGDGALDGVDPFPLDGKENRDTDLDGIGDNTDEDIDGDAIKNSEDVDPLNPAPKAEVDHKVYLAGIDEEITFNAEKSLDETGIIEYIWNFEDQTFTGPTVTHKFATPGLYAASLKVLDANGQYDSIDFKIRVLNKGFVLFTFLFSLLLLLLAFYIIYRYNRRARGSESPEKISKSKKKQ
jgi:hypothetical protein